MSVATSLLLGALLGAANAAVALLLARRGRSLDLNGMMKVVLGGGFVRLLVLLVAVVVLFVTVPVHRLAFVGGLGVVYALGLALEVALVLGRPSAPRDA
ncbi:MAG TPA: hypothetical protein VGB53_02565 [Rubricoccaceae bacterium]|jgi:hypothetical protein